MSTAATRSTRFACIRVHRVDPAARKPRRGQRGQARPGPAPPGSRASAFTV